MDSIQFADEVEQERKRQKSLGWTSEHDKNHGPFNWVSLISMRLFKMIQVMSKAEFRKRMIQIAAICLAFIQANPESEDD